MVLGGEREGKGVAGVVDGAGLCCAVGREKVGEPAHVGSVNSQSSWMCKAKHSYIM